MTDRRHLTKREIDSLTIPEGKKDRHRVYDDEIHGYGVTVYPSGRKSFFLEYGPDRRRRRMKLGDYGPLTSEAARKAALDAKGKIIAGGDPLADRDRIRKMPTFRAWADSYMDTIRSNRKDPRKIELFLEETKAKWGNRLLSEITVEDVKEEFQRLTRRGGRAGQGGTDQGEPLARRDPRLPGGGAQGVLHPGQPREPRYTEPGEPTTEPGARGQGDETAPCCCGAAPGSPCRDCLPPAD